MPENSECSRCQYYAHDFHLVCAVNPNGVIGHFCPDFRLNPEHPRLPFVDFLGLHEQTEESLELLDSQRLETLIPLAYDNICKRLAAEYPSAFVHWLLAVDDMDIQKLPTELSREPIRADALYFLPRRGQILHLEFQTEPQSNPPLPFRMLDYWVRLYRQYGWQHGHTIEQVVIFLKHTDSEAVNISEFAVGNTVHRYRVLRMWEQDPKPLLANPALLPLAVLARTDSPAALLKEVAVRVDMIEEQQQQREISAYTEILAGLKFDLGLIRQNLREELMRESVIYQQIQQEIREEVRLEALQEGEATLVLRLLARKVGQISPSTRSHIQQLPVEQLEELGEALLDFDSMQDLTDWLQANRG